MGRLSSGVLCPGEGCAFCIGALGIGIILRACNLDEGRGAGRLADGTGDTG